LASPPDVHQCNTSTSPAWAAVIAAEPANANATTVAIFESFNIVSPISFVGSPSRLHRYTHPDKHHACPN